MIGSAGFMAAPKQQKSELSQVATSVRKLGDAQITVLRMMNPEWVSSRKKPDSRSLSILRSLETRALVHENFGRWTLTQQGRVVKDSLPN